MKEKLKYQHPVALITQLYLKDTIMASNYDDIIGDGDIPDLTV